LKQHKNHSDDATSSCNFVEWHGRIEYWGAVGPSSQHFKYNYDKEDNVDEDVDKDEDEGFPHQQERLKRK